MLNKKLSSVFIIICLMLSAYSIAIAQTDNLSPNLSPDAGMQNPAEGYVPAGSDKAVEHSKTGFIHYNKGLLDEAIAEFETALKIEPGDPFSIYYLGLSYVKKEDFEKAINIWQGYRNKEKPLVEEEIGRQLTLLQIAYSRKLALKSLAEEDQLMTVKSDKNTVAVCYYKDLSPDESMRAFQKAITAMVITDLSKIKSIKVVERLRLQALLDEMKLGQTGIVDESSAPKIGKLLRAENIVVGNLVKGSINASTSVVASSEKDKIKGASSASVEHEKFFELPIAIVKDIVSILGINLSEEEKKATSTIHTKVYEAFINYGRALDALDDGRWKEASDFFNLALFADPSFDLARQGFETCPAADAPNVNNVTNISGEILTKNAETSISIANATDISSASIQSSIDTLSTQSRTADTTKTTITKTDLPDSKAEIVSQTLTDQTTNTTNKPEIPHEFYGYFSALVTVYESPFKYLEGIYISTSIQDFSQPEFSASHGNNEMRIKSGDPLYITGLQTRSDTISGSYSISNTGTGEDSYMVWGYWTQTTPMAGSVYTYFVDNKGYWIRGEKTSHEDMQSLMAVNSWWSYSGGAEGTYWTDAGGADMTGTFNAKVNFHTQAIADFNLSVGDGAQHSVNVNSASGSIDPNGQLSVSSQTFTAYGSFYGPEAQNMGGVWKDDFATGLFHGTKQGVIGAPVGP